MSMSPREISLLANIAFDFISVKRGISENEMKWSHLLCGHINKINQLTFMGPHVCDSVYSFEFAQSYLRHLKAHSPEKCEIPKNTRPRHLKKFRTQYIFVSNCF